MSNKLIPNNVKGKWGYYSTYFEKIVIPFEFDSAETFINGFAIVSVDNKFGLINENGIKTIPINYNRLERYGKLFYTGYSLLNNQGFTIIELKRDELLEKSSKFEQFNKYWKEKLSHSDSKYIYFYGDMYDLSGNKINRKTYEYMTDFDKFGLSIVQTFDSGRDREYSVINEKGEELVYKYNDIGKFKDSEIAIVMENGSYISGVYDDYGPVHTYEKDKWGFINIRGEEIIEPSYSKIEWVTEYIAESENTRFYFEKGNLIKIEDKNLEIN